MKTKLKTQTAQEALDSTKRKQYVNSEVVREIPDGSADEELEFFKLYKYISDNDLEKEYENRGLQPASIFDVCAFDVANPEKMDEMEWVATHWKNKEGRWCYAAWGRWDGERKVNVDQDGHDWHDDWWFAGVRKSDLKTKKLSSGPESLDLGSRVEKLEKEMAALKKILRFLSNEKELLK